MRFQKWYFRIEISKVRLVFTLEKFSRCREFRSLPLSIDSLIIFCRLKRNSGWQVTGLFKFMLMECPVLCREFSLWIVRGNEVVHVQSVAVGELAASVVVPGIEAGHRVVKTGLFLRFVTLTVPVIFFRSVLFENPHTVHTAWMGNISMKLQNRDISRITVRNICNILT